MPPSPSDPAAYDPAAGEKLIIETPEQTSIEFPLAGIGSRFLALLIDTLIQGAIVIVLVLIFVGLGFGLSSAGFGRSSAAAVWIVAILIFAYFLLMWILYPIRIDLERSDARQTLDAYPRDQGFRPAYHRD